MSSQETAFSVDMLRRLDSEILLDQISYKQRADIYNNIHCGKDSEGRKLLDRRRLETAHFRYAVLMVTKWYPDIPLVKFSPNINHTLLEVTPIYHTAFHRKYTAHRCKEAGCGTVLVLDGNLKNSRDVCAAQHAGFVEYSGLPGRVTTGCMESPEQSSKFCPQHVTRMSKTVRHRDDPDNRQGGVIEMILAKKVTRNNTFYQVLWLELEDCKVTWENGENLPPDVIQEFERGDRSSIADQVDSKMGQKIHTLVFSKDKTQAERHHSRPLTAGNTGSFIDTEGSATLSCNTEKDKSRLHCRTAGVLAGMWPCGIVTLLDELYRAESKSQIVGSLVLLFQLFPQSSDANFEF